MTFFISVHVHGKTYRMQVERFYLGASVEKFKVSAGGREVIIESDRPHIKATGSKKAPGWKIIKADIYPEADSEAVADAMFQIFKAIDHHMELLH